jgi:hypothetical protein
LFTDHSIFISKESEMINLKIWKELTDFIDIMEPESK